MSAAREKVVWITGASTGIGLSIASAFAGAGYKTILSSRRQFSNIKDLPEYISQNIIDHPLDLRDSDSIRSAIKSISENFEIECLVNNAGVTAFKPSISTSHEEINEIIAVNLKAPIHLITELLPEMKKSGGGTIVNILSVAAKKIFINSSVYAASKAGFAAYSNVLREEIRSFGIRVINVFPGATATPIWPEEVLRKNKNRMMNTDDLASIILQLFMNRTTAVPEEITIRPISGDL
ncbi:MAG: SDR family NAD(P)-dependent oxidoreductase [Ignavibacteriales bacterium]|nr:SDR family NAD(P)-dependent oxidoreductase [Ignavibacteriales bacterium]MCF8316059.1 SDR family NAD(P)-dependent oxidoreductase [Ignavibacteriales bacterium]MCF8436561.1 SDR family NAD(P)-dependent oxidoreductase [Ignavibacteriales bacterium]